MDATVYLGVWTNWSRGHILCQTLTTTKFYGNLLIAFTAFFVAFVATRFWRIVCLLLHNYYSTSEARTTIHHQRQVILRNSTSPESGLVAFLRLIWAWRPSERRRLASVLPPLLTASFCVIAFTVAGVFSSMISTSTGDDGLIKSSNCGV